MRLVFMGSPDFAVPALAEALTAGHEIAAVYSQPPRPAGRGQADRPTPVAAFAAARGLPVRTPLNFKAQEDSDAFAALEADAAIVVAYGLILPKAVLEAPRLGCFNLHASLLPRWRGAAPIQRAIMAGDTRTGVQVMRMEAGLDTGPICLSESTPITADDTAQSLHDRLAQIGASLLPRALAALARDSLSATPQSEDGVTYAAKITAADTRIDWSKPAKEIDAQIRGLSPAPGAWFGIPDGKGGNVRVKALLSRVEDGAGAPGKILDDNLLIACSEGAVRLLRVQREGKAALSAEEFLRGNALPAGSQLS
ncbi:MAG: methionyl-tRNA formyltransferase [Caulobacterales bacterium]